MHVTHPVPPLVTPSGRTFTPEVEHVVKVALAKDAVRRFASAHDMLAAVDAAVYSQARR
jgi:hypothetical protein